MSTSEDFIGQNALISYLSDNNRTTKTYRGFLKNHHDIIIASIDTTSNLDNWKNLDNLWAVRFLREEKNFLKKDFPDLKVKLDIKSNIHPFYEISNENIKNSMDLSTIISKLENNQYANIEEFKKNIRLIFRNCYIYNDIGSEMHILGEELELTFNKIWAEKIDFQVKQKENLKRTRNNDSDSSSELITKQIRILEQNKDKLVYRQVVNDALLIASAYENLIANNILPFIELLKTFLLTRSQISLSSADESVLQAIVENLLPLKYRIPELSLVMDGTKLKGFGRFGYSDIFILKGIGNNNISLELKYISLVGLIKSQIKKFNTNDLENLDKIIEKEDEKILLKRSYEY
ncbi:hypothetical protein C1646_758360, partial [Rhizophagus diaphanus]